MKTTPLKAIRQKCLDCSCYQPKEVKFCSAVNCVLYPYRFGKNPARQGIAPGRSLLAQKQPLESSKTTENEALNDR